MDKLLLLTILAATVAIPAWAARGRSARRGLGMAIFGTLAFDLFYLMVLTLLYPLP